MLENIRPKESSDTSAWLMISLGVKLIEQLGQFRTTNVMENALAEHLIPRDEDLDRLLRYETSIERSLGRSLDRLERLQHRRKGEPVLPPVNVRITR